MKSRPLFCDLFDQGILLHTMLIILCVYLVYICVSDIVCFMYYNNFRVQILWCINTNNERWGYRSKYSLHIQCTCILYTNLCISLSINPTLLLNQLIKSARSQEFPLCFCYHLLLSTCNTLQTTVGMRYNVFGFRIKLPWTHNKHMYMCKIW